MPDGNRIERIIPGLNPTVSVSFVNDFIVPQTSGETLASSATAAAKNLLGIRDYNPSNDMAVVSVRIIR
jgi:hypothetical protein